MKDRRGDDVSQDFDFCFIFSIMHMCKDKMMKFWKSSKKLKFTDAL